jgi:hypothetical protein
MNHSPLPWRITDATEKKGREIVDARGNTVAKLTALDIPNAELMVKAANATISEIKHITDPSQLENKREYWLVDKVFGWKGIEQCRMRNGLHYFQEYIWAHTDNNQAMSRWDIFGPLPLHVAPDFAALKAQSAS